MTPQLPQPKIFTVWLFIFRKKCVPLRLTNMAACFLLFHLTLSGSPDLSFFYKQRFHVYNWKIPWSTFFVIFLCFMCFQNWFLTFIFPKLKLQQTSKIFKWSFSISAPYLDENFSNAQLLFFLLRVIGLQITPNASRWRTNQASPYPATLLFLYRWLRNLRRN